MSDRRRVVALPVHGWEPPESIDDAPVVSPPATPLAEIEALARAMTAENAVDAADIMRRGGEHLRHAIVDELHRRIGALIVAVAQAETVRDKLGRALAHGERLLSLPVSTDIVSRCDDPVQVAAEVRAACDGLVTFLAAELERSLTAVHAPVPRDCRAWVMRSIDHLRHALAYTEDDRLDHRARLAVYLAAELDLPRGQGFPSEAYRDLPQDWLAPS